MFVEGILAKVRELQDTFPTGYIRGEELATLGRALWLAARAVELGLKAYTKDEAETNALFAQVLNNTLGEEVRERLAQEQEE